MSKLKDVDTDNIFDKLTELLTLAAADISASELQGLLTGIFVIEANTDKVNWQQQLSDNITVLEDVPELNKEISNIIKKLEYSFKDLQFDFDLLLPDDNAEIGFKTRCLALWCTGFLAGVGLCKLDINESEIVKEVVSDFSNIAQASTTGDDEEEEETAYTELLEYVKVAVQNMHIELNIDAGKGSKTLH